MAGNLGPFYSPDAFRQVVLMSDRSPTHYPVEKSDAEWREQLDPMQYQVARHAATERAFTGKYWDHFHDGKYLCVGCGTPLFESGTKFDAGCGWPSYWQPVNADVIEEVRDTTHGMVRAKTPKGKGYRFTVDIWADNEHGEKKTVGWVEVDVGV